MTPIRHILGGLALTAALATPSAAQPPPAAPPSRPQEESEQRQEPRTEWGVLVGAATGQVFDARRTDTDIVLGGLRWGRRLGDGPAGVAFLVEVLPLYTVSQQPRAWGGGLDLLLRYTFGDGDWRPAILGGVGLVVADEKVPPTETRVNFTPQVGAGLRRMLARNVAITLEYRFHHLSNAGLSEANPGINSHMAVVLVSWFR